MSKVEKPIQKPGIIDDEEVKPKEKKKSKTVDVSEGTSSETEVDKSYYPRERKERRQIHSRDNNETSRDLQIQYKKQKQTQQQYPQNIPPMNNPNFDPYQRYPQSQIIQNNQQQGYPQPQMIQNNQYQGYPYGQMIQNNPPNIPMMNQQQNQYNNYNSNNVPPQYVNQSGYENFSSLEDNENSSSMDLDYQFDLTKELEADNYATVPDDTKKIPKQALVIHNATKGGAYNGSGGQDFLKTQHDATTVVNKTMIVSTFLFNFADDIFLKVVRPTKYLQCNQSVFNYPVAVSRTNFRIKKVEKNIKALSDQVLAYKKNIIKSLGGEFAEDEKKFTTNVPADVVKETLRFAARGAAYMNTVYEKAMKLLNQLVVNAGNRTYPSVEHHLYEGDYSDLFAFNVLRYLFKIDSEKEINIPTDKEMSKGLKEKDSSYIYKTTKKRGKEAVNEAEKPAVQYFGQHSKDPKTFYEIDDMTDEKNFVDTEGVEDMEDDDEKSMFSGVSNNKSSAKKPKVPTTKKPKQSYAPEEVFLKPTRGTKILLITEPNVFMYNLNYAVAKGISILMNCGVIPEKIITNLKICSLYTGAIYKISSTKTNLKIGVDKTCKSYAIMKQPSWTQQAVMVDLLPLKYQTNEIKNVILKYQKKYPTALFDANKYTFTGQPHLPGVQANCVKLLKAAWKDKVLEEFKSQLEKIKKLGCKTPSTFAKVSSINKMKYFNGMAAKINYNATSDTLEGKVVTVWMHPPKLPQFDYGYFGLSDDVDISYYREGINYTNKSLIMPQDEYVKAAARDLSQFKRLQIPLLHRGDEKHRTEKFIGLDHLGPTEDTITEEILTNLMNACPFDKETLAPEFDRYVQDLLDANDPNLGTYILSTFVPQWREYYQQNEFDTHIGAVTDGLEETQNQRLIEVSDALIRVLRDTDRKYKNGGTDYRKVLGSLFRYVFCDRRLTNEDVRGVTKQDLTKFCDDLVSDINITRAVGKRSEHYLGKLFEHLVQTVSNQFDIVEYEE